MTETIPQIQHLMDVISIRLSKEQKKFIEENNVAVGVWLRNMINKEMEKVTK